MLGHGVLGRRLGLLGAGGVRIGLLLGRGRGVQRLLPGGFRLPEPVQDLRLAVAHRFHDHLCRGEVVGAVTAEQRDHRRGVLQDAARDVRLPHPAAQRLPLRLDGLAGLLEPGLRLGRGELSLLLGEDGASVGLQGRGGGLGGHAEAGTGQLGVAGLFPELLAQHRRPGLRRELRGGRLLLRAAARVRGLPRGARRRRAVGGRRVCRAAGGRRGPGRWPGAADAEGGAGPGEQGRAEEGGRQRTPTRTTTSRSCTHGHLYDREGPELSPRTGGAVTAGQCGPTPRGSMCTLMASSWGSATRIAPVAAVAMSWPWPTPSRGSTARTASARSR